MSDNTTAAVSLRGIGKVFDDFIAVKKADLDIPHGSFVTLLGPSGCGKTTLLRMIAGLEEPSEGEILIKGRRVNEIPIHKRNLGLVFQNYALFPHKTVFDNIAFGLRYRKTPKVEIHERVKKALDIVRLPGVEKRLPSQLSGGQQQRIALARSIVIEPDVLLLDEPLSALDANLREEMRVELKNIQRTIGVTTIFVTHDQEEALSMSDLVVVMDHGRMEQVGTPQEVYREPQTRFVADFLGQSNILAGQLTGYREGYGDVTLANGASLRARSHDRLAPQAVEVVVRAHRVLVHPPEAKALNGTNVYQGRVADVNYLGGLASYFIEVNDTRVQAINPIVDRMFGPGDEVQLFVEPSDCVLLDTEGRRIG